MKPEDQRIAIAEACGWKRHTDKEHQYSGSHKVVEGWIRQKPGTTGLNTFDFEWRDAWNLPDYPSDLNAMHEVEETLNDLGLNHMVQFLYEIPGRFWRATAAQRAEAFLRATGKWVD